MDITPGGEATAQIKDDDDSGVARLNFRVRCETIGYGESIFLYREDSKARVSVLFQKKKKKKIMVALEAHLPKKKKRMMDRWTIERIIFILKKETILLVIPWRNIE